MYYLNDILYVPTYDVIYDWEAVILNDEFDESIEDEEEEEELEDIPELWLPGTTEIGQA